MPPGRLAAASRTRHGSSRSMSSAREDYREFLDLTNFSSGIGAKLAFHFIGFGIGRRKHADRQGAYDSLRSSGFLGLCLSEQKVGNPLRARDYCQRALKHAPKDPIAYFLLGNINRDILQRAPVLRRPDGRAHLLRAHAGDQSRPRRVEERAQLPRADRRHPAAARLSGEQALELSQRTLSRGAHPPYRLSCRNCSDRFHVGKRDLAPWRAVAAGAEPLAGAWRRRWSRTTGS